MHRRSYRPSFAAPLAVMIAAHALPASTTHGQGLFVEDPVIVLHTFSPAGGQFGWGIAELTDIDNPPDGVLDFILPSPGTNQVFVYSGATCVLGQSCQLLHLLTPPGGTPAGARFGHAVGDAGDVDNDGVNDIIVGAVLTTNGTIYIYSGADGSLILDVSGEAAGDQFGFGVGGTGDVNNDNHDDVVVGAPRYSGGQGRGYIISGLDGSEIRHFDGEHAGAQFGLGAAGTGDIDGDTIGDQIIGSPGANGVGKAYVYSGADGSLIFDTQAEAGGSNYGEFFVAGVGDVNDDGTNDVYVGDYNANGGNGKAYVYSGVDGTPIHVIPGAIGAGLGPGRGAGDVDGDSHADLIIGHYTSSAGAANAGRAVIYSGATGLPLRTITSRTGNENFGFDAVGVGDVNGDDVIEYLVSAASASRVYLIDGREMLPCESETTVSPTLTTVAKNRYLSFSAGTPAVLGGEAVRITFVDLPGAYSAWNGTQMWVGPPVARSEVPSVIDPAGAPPGSATFFQAPLQCSPTYLDWTAFAQVHVSHEGIVPGGVYDIQVIHRGCDTAIEAEYTAPESLENSRWGDIVSNCSTNPCGPPNHIVDITDVVAILDKFKNLATAPVKARADIEPRVVDLRINITDVTAALGAFSGATYPFVPSGGPPCP